MSLFNLLGIFDTSVPEPEEEDFPEYICGFKVDYRSPIPDPCPGCGGQVYRSVSNRGMACCTGCKHILRVWPDY